MRSAKSIMCNRTTAFSKASFAALFILSINTTFAQENSPYTRYGLGDISPNTNIVNRGMGGISAGYSDVLSINFNNPASYSNFQTYLEQKSGRPISGRVLLDVGINYENKTIRNPNQPLKFSSSYAYFSYVQVGLPLNKNWGLNFGLRPLSRINYKINRIGPIIDPTTNKYIDSALTEFTGEGGTFLPSIGTGYAIKNFSIGVNMGYLFGKKVYSTKRAFLNDAVAYQSSNHSTRSYIGDLFFNAGAQYKIDINKQTVLRLGVSGNWEQKINATRDIIRETFVRDVNGADTRVDSVYEAKDESGEVIYPSSYTAGFVIENTKQKGNGWLLGVDYINTMWNNYRFFNSTDSVKNNWQLRVGAQIRPEPGKNYLSNVAYRAGFFVGPDYINIGRKLPQFGVSFGLGLPIANYNMAARGQFTVVNLGFEYSKRGNNNNILKEDLFRLSIGLNFSDIWFSKRRYD